MNKYYEITNADIGKPSIKAFGSSWMVANVWGRTLPQDVGKRVYLRGDIIQIENDEQRKRRQFAAS